MKTHRIRFGRRGRSRRTRSYRSTQLRFLRLASLEGLELRTMLSGGSLLSDSAWYANDVYSTPIHALSVANMLASTLSHQQSNTSSSNSSGSSSETASDPPAAAPLAATSDGDQTPDDPPVSPLAAEGVLANVFLRVQDLDGNDITSIETGQDFKLQVFVDDVRTSTPIGGNLFGVFAAYVRVTYDSNLVSLADTVQIDDFFNDVLAEVDTSTAGVIRAGGNSLVTTNPGTDPQLLWSVTLTANNAGSVDFQSFFETFPENEFAEWLLYGQQDEPYAAENFTFESAQLDIEGPPSISISDVTQQETDASQNYVFTVSLSDASAQQVTVAYATNSGTATAGQDFVAQSGTLTFAPGATQQLITITVLGDTDIEADETFSVVLSNPVVATIADDTGVGTIENDDTPFIGISGVSQLEGNEQNTMVFTVTISKASVEPVLVGFATQNGSATAGSDYAGTSGTLTFAPGSTVSQFITVTINGDTDVEENEDFQVVLTEPSNATFDESNGQATGTLLNDDGPHISFVNNHVSQSEDQTTFVFTVTIGEAGENPVTVVYTTADGSALAGSDYTATSGTLTFSGETVTQDITVVVNNDQLDELDEDFSLILSDPVNATLVETTATGTIEDDDAAPTLSFESDMVSEDEGTAIVFTVNLSAPSGQEVTVQYVTEDITATAGSDYTGISTQTLTFMPGETQKLVTVLVNSDDLNEPDETFRLRLFGATNVSNTEDVVATGTILNDDPVPILSVTGPADTSEGNAGTKQFVYTATLSAASGQDIFVTWSTADGSATSPSDYAAASGTLTFAAGETTKMITIGVVGDTVKESTEQFTINLTDPQNVTLAQDSVTATITNDDDVPTLSIGNAASQNEGDVGATPFFFTVTLSSASDETITVQFATQNQDASTLDNDFVGTSGTLTFAPGETTQVITVLVNGDTKHEAVNESFAVNLSSPLGATIANGVGNALIVDDDPIPTISISDATVDEGDSGTTPVVFTVTLSGETVGTVFVNFATQDGTATLANNDYNETSGTLTFAPGVLTQVLTVFVVGDNFVEPDETFSVVLSDPQGASLGDSTGVGTIKSESSDEISIEPSSVSGKVFVDSNNNQAQNGREKSLAGILVFLSGTTDTGGQVNQQTTTGANGTYSFNGLDPGTYTLSFNISSQYFAGHGTAGSAGGTTDGNKITFTLEAPGGIAGTDYNFMTKGLLPQFISQRVFLASELGATDSPADEVSVDANTVTDPINSSNAVSTTISGTGTVGATISVVATDGTNSTSAQTTTVGNGGTWSISGINVTSLGDGTITYNVTATSAGDATAQDSITSTKDTVAPTVTIGSTTNPINSANADDTTASGTGTVGATISVVATDGVNSTAAKTATVDASGNWSVSGIDTSALNDGTITYNASASDDAGNTATASMTTTKDTVAPAVQVSMVQPDPINAENQENVTISGTGTVGATISVVVSDTGSSTAPHTTTVDSNGDWTITGIDVTQLEDGTLTFSVTATDEADNTTTISTTADKDTVTQVAITGVTDPINAAGADSVTVSGTGEVGATVSVVAGDGVNSTSAQMTTVDGDGNWSVTLDVSALDDGTVTFTASATDTLGNSDEDTTTAEKDTVAEVAITSLTDPITIENAANVSIGGTGEVGASISVVASDGVNTTIAYMTTVDGDGNWSIVDIDVTGLADGTITFTVTTTDVAGNAGETSDTATKASLVIASVTDPINEANQTSVVVSGTGEVGAMISVVADDGSSSTDAATTTVDSEGNWSVMMDVSSLSDGTITFTVTATDDQDNSIESSITAEKDTVAPAVAITGVTDPINAAGAGSVVISGTGEVGAQISVVADDGATSTDAVMTTVDGDGNWTVMVDASALNDGTITFTATATDGAGNTADDSMTAEKDTVTQVAVSDVTDPIDIGTAASVSISGTGEVGAEISVVASDGVNTTIAYMTTVGGDGSWSIDNIDVTGLDDGTITFTVTGTDGAGNTAETSDTATKTALAIASVDDPINADNQTTIVVSGTGEVGAAISVVASDGANETAPEMTTIDGDGNWSVTVDVSALNDGTITFTVTATDGEDNSVEKTITAEKDTVAPAVAITDLPEFVNMTTATSVPVSGTGEVGATISVVVDDGVNSTDPVMTTVDGDGNWSVTIDTTGIVSGTITFTATASDGAGNTAEDSDTAVKDTVITAAIAGATDPVNADNVTMTQAVGNGDANATVELVVTDGVNSTGTFSTTSDGVGEWSFANVDVSGLNDGTITYMITLTDLAGNSIETSTTVTKDTVAPALAITGMTNPINADNADSASISGTGEVSAMISLVVSDGVHSTETFMTTVDGDGNWSFSGIDLTGLDDTSVTYSVTAEDAAGNTADAEAMADKDTVAPAVNIDSVTDPIDTENAVAVAIAGTGEVGATITVVASDGVNSTIAYMTTVDGDGNWSIADIDVSGLNDGTLTFTATAEDAAGNTAEDQITAEKTTAAAPLALTDGGDDDEDDELDIVAAALTASSDDPDATDEALAGEEEWLYS